MRKLIVLIALLVIIAAALPGVDGYFFKQQYTNTLNATAKLISKKGDLKVVDYQEGWFGSDVKIAYSMTDQRPNPSAIAMHSTVEMVQHISHGPFIYDSINKHWALGMATIQSDLALPLPMGVESFHTDTIASFMGDYISRSTMPPYTLALPNLKVNWQGLTADATAKVVGDDFKYMKATVVIGALSGQAESGAALQTQNINMDYEMEPQPVGIPNGHYTITVPSVVITSPTEGQMTLNNLTFTTLVNVNSDNSFNGHMQLSLDKWLTSNYSITQSTIKVLADNLNGPGFNNLNALELTKDQIANEFPTLLTPKTVFSETAALNTSFGRLISDGQVAWTAPVKTTQDVATNAKAHFNVRVSVTLIDKMIELMATKDQQQAAQAQSASADQPQPVSHAEQAKADIQNWLKQGYIAQDKDDYVTELTFEQGSLKANGVELSATPKTPAPASIPTPDTTPAAAPAPAAPLPPQ